MGDALLRKTFKTDLMQPYPKKNTGQRPQKYVENNHPAIIDRETFAAAQAEIERRTSIRSYITAGHGRYSGRFAFSDRIVCAECGATFRRHNFRNHAKPYPKIEPVWTCKNHITRGEVRCAQLPIKEQYLEDLFINTLNELLSNKQTVLDELEVIITESIAETGGVTDGNQVIAIDAEIERLQAEVMELNRKRTKREITQDGYKTQSEKAMSRLDGLFAERDAVTEINGNAALEKAKLEMIQKFFQAEREQTAFSKDVFVRLVATVTVKSRADITFEFKNGLQIKAKTE
jgi:uncharacterized lipoprotein YmbA